MAKDVIHDAVKAALENDGWTMSTGFIHPSSQWEDLDGK